MEGIVGTIIGAILGSVGTFLIVRYQANRQTRDLSASDRATAIRAFRAAANGLYYALDAYVDNHDDKDRAAKVLAAHEPVMPAYLEVIGPSSSDAIAVAAEHVLDAITTLGEVSMPYGLIKTSASSVKIEEARDAFRRAVVELAMAK